MAYSWTYGDWRTYSDQAARAARLALHLAEMEAVRDAISASGGGMSASYSDLESRIANLQAVWERMDEKARAQSAGVRHNLRLHRPTA